MSDVPSRSNEGGDAESRVIDAARSGDEDAWEWLYRRVYPRLRAYLARRVEPEHVDDAVSETMARSVAGIDGFTLGPSGFDGWVFGIARHVSADLHRRADRSERHAVSEFIATGAAGPVSEPGDEVLLSEEHLVVRGAFEALTPGERELLELRVVAGLSVEETAVALGKRPGAVRTAQSRAIANLRRHMGRSNA